MSVLDFIRDRSIDVSIFGFSHHLLFIHSVYIDGKDDEDGG